jgi:hypothetical protein
LEPTRPGGGGVGTVDCVAVARTGCLHERVLAGGLLGRW